MPHPDRWVASDETKVLLLILQKTINTYIPDTRKEKALIKGQEQMGQ